MTRSPEGATPIPEEAKRFGKEVPKPVDFGKGGKEVSVSIETKTHESQERKLRAVKESVKSVHEILKTSPDLTETALAAAQKDIESITGKSSEVSRRLLKDALIELNENLAERLKDSSVQERLVAAIEQLADGGEEEGDETKRESM